MVWNFSNGLFNGEQGGKANHFEIMVARDSRLLECSARKRNCCFNCRIVIPNLQNKNLNTIKRGVTLTL